MSIPDTRHILARERARESSRRFYRGAPCGEGHEGIRYTSTAHCVECAKAARRAQLDKVKSRKKSRIPDS